MRVDRDHNLTGPAIATGVRCRRTRLSTRHPWTYGGRIQDDGVLRGAADVEPGLLDRVESLGRAADAATGAADGGGVDLQELAELVLAQVCAGLGAPAGMLVVVRGSMAHVVA